MLQHALLGWSLSLSLILAGADTAKQNQAVTRLTDVDSDFAFQGEYAGAIVWACYRQNVGLQVVAGGDGQFDALMYPGGLPGNGYNGSAKIKLSGHRDGDRVQLTGDGVQATLATGLAVTMQNSQGGLLGYLQPMHRFSSTLGAPPPAGAKVLFAGSDISHWKNAKVSDEGLLQIGAETIEPVESFTLHGEFKTPYMPYARGQARGNSGFYIQKRYEVQVLDSFGQEPAINEISSLYKFKAPDMNLAFPPLSWQTYDIDFTAAKFDAEGKKVSKARITVRLNGVVVQNNVELENKTGGGSQEGPNPLPLLLQNHGNPVEYRNIWIIDRSGPTTYAPTCVPCCSYRIRR